MEKKQTAVQFLLSHIADEGKDMIGRDILEQALQMEREQIEEAFNKGYDDHEYNNTETKFGADPDVYYTEQPFNLETALKHPEWVYFRNGEKPLEWHWFENLKSKWVITSIDMDGGLCTQRKDGTHSPKIDFESIHDLILRVPYQTVYVSILPHGEAKWNTCDSGVDGQLYCVPVKIPATI